MEITAADLPRVRAALRDILFLYVDLIESYGGFGHNLDAGHFDPFEFLDNRIVDPLVGPRDVDLELLECGAACALLCRCVDACDDHGRVDPESPALREVAAAWRAGRFARRPVIAEAFRLAFEGEEAVFRAQLERVVAQHVLGYFARLARG